MTHRPRGTITFLLTDIEGSARQWAARPEAMRTAIERHDAIVKSGIESHDGAVLTERGEGDSFFAVFNLATDAVAAACSLQQQLQAETWPEGISIKVRMALLSGEAGGDYRGPTANKCARLRELAHGGQVLLSASVRELAQDSLPRGISLKHLGEHQLRDLDRPERVFQVLDQEVVRLEPVASRRWLLRWRWAIGLGATAVVLAAGISFAVSQRLSASGPTITTFAGSGVGGFSGDGLPAFEAEFDRPSGVAVGSHGDVFIVDGHRIRKVDSAGRITTVAGIAGSPGYSGDGGSATQAQLHTFSASLGGPNPAQGLAVDRDGKLYIADYLNNRVRRVVQGTITTVAGSDSEGFSGDGGAATSAALAGPRGLAIAAGGDLYVADTSNNRIRKVNPSGIISTVAGGDHAGFAGDGGRATDALLDAPLGLALDDEGALYVADSGNHRVRKVTPSGMISTYAGTGEAGHSGDGQRATGGMLRLPVSLAFDSRGNLYIADSQDHTIRKVDVGETITTFAGTGKPGYSGDNGSAIAARIWDPLGVAVDSLGNVYLADSQNNRIRRVH